MSTALIHQADLPESCSAPAVITLCTSCNHILHQLPLQMGLALQLAQSSSQLLFDQSLLIVFLLYCIRKPSISITAALKLCTFSLNYFRQLMKISTCLKLSVYLCSKRIGPYVSNQSCCCRLWQLILVGASLAVAASVVGSMCFLQASHLNYPGKIHHPLSSSPLLPTAEN